MGTSKHSVILKKQGLKKTQIIWDKCFRSSNHLFVVYDLLNKILSSNRNHKGGAPTEEQQDLLRSAILFSCAGLDAILKQMIEDNLVYLIDHEEKTKDRFEKFVARKIKNGEDSSMNCKYISKVISSNEPKAYLINEWKQEIKDGSLQSVDEIIKICDYMSIEEKQLFKDKDENNRCRSIFIERNRIAHEMDINFSEGRKRNRRSRNKTETEKQCSDLQDLGSKIIFLLDAKIK